MRDLRFSRRRNLTGRDAQYRRFGGRYALHFHVSYPSGGRWRWQQQHSPKR